MTSPAAVSLSHITKTYSGQEKPALDDVSLTVHEGEILGIIGHSGAGKSTLVRTINGLEDPDSGIVRIGDAVLTGASEKEKCAHRREIGMIFQHFNLFSSRTVANNVAYPLKIARWSKADRTARVQELLEFVGLEHLADRYPEQLSGGQKQRVGIARALAASPKVLLADEATSALDPDTTREVLALLKRINKELGLTIIVVTHHMSIVKAICDRVAVMSGGVIVERASAYDFFSDPQSSVSRSFLPSLHSPNQDELVINVRKFPQWASELSRLTAVTWEIVRADINTIDDKRYGTVAVTISGPAPQVADVYRHYTSGEK